MVNPRTFFDFAVDNKPVGRVIFELFSDTAPKTCENFRALCTGEKGLSPLSGNPLYYKNSIIHRSIKDFMIQGGDFTKRNGTGGESIYGGTFPDEDLSRPLDAEGLLCMANKGPDTNGSQFFVTLRACPHLNGKHVVFGKVIRGYEIVKEIEKVAVDQKDRPSVPIEISNCGELVLRKQEGVPKAQEEKSHSVSESEGESDDSRRHKKRRHKHRSETRDEEEEKRRHRKKSKHRRRSPSGSPRPKGEKDDPEKKLEPEEETEEQYDARLEREEKERLEAARKRELERLKKQREAVVSSNGVRFKGRGRMKYLDPELRRDDGREHRPY